MIDDVARRLVKNHASRLREALVHMETLEDRIEALERLSVASKAADGGQAPRSSGDSLPDSS